jgi:chorismate dehydratase
MEKIRISAVRYANTYPFIYGLTETGFDNRAIIETDHPAGCAAKLISGKADIGLIPVAVIPLLKEPHILSNYCIGANGRVRTVQLMSNTRLENIKTVFLDYRSRTSIMLVKVLARNKWKSEFNWADTREGFDFTGIGKNEAVVLIGDQCFEFESSFEFKYDLALEWKEYSGLPFVFACWTANRELPESFIGEFNNALARGVNNIDLVVERFSNSGPISGPVLKEYLTKNIDFDLNDEKRQAVKVFLGLMKEL